tara:strand:- start:152 stop:1072 length:921 start_codon:yes stop_codon:yes gene_type:complete
MGLKLIFMGTPEFAVPILKSLKESEHKILSVYTQPPKKSNRGQLVHFSPVHQFSKKIKIDVRSPNLLNNQEEIDFLKKIKPDVVVVVAYGKIIPSQMLNLKNIKFINIHASLLPRWRGAAPIQRAIMECDEETGISIMQIIPELDAGPYILQEKIKIDKKDNYISLSQKLCNLGSKLILKSLKLIEQNNYELIEQNKSNISYASKIDKKESEIDWNLPANNLIAKINGLNPYPGVWFYHKGIRLKIIDAIEVDQSGRIGEVLDNNLTVACKQKAIRVLSIQKEGKKILKTKDFLTGYKIEQGEKLA